ncbi:hypothetical protein N4264_15955 [Tahibacter amnicola]|uniref:DUF11 domain-containing protein n=1 Tax=Tahibacter amnicola TaxID=2976241 RepID=A0ABY6B8Y4_9GAMM|nr:hypothetical protein [Tahibacter amnicola]UXI66242.1 hypothetical protein N4264_15955 [Tahibacter amnicola]
MLLSQWICRLALPVSGIAVLLSSGGAHAQVSLTTMGVPYTQSFDTLPASGSATWTNNSTVPGWFHARTGTGTTIVANDGSSNAGNLYSYGTGTATDRALGALGSGNAAIGNLFWGVRLQNNTGATITALDVSFVGEQWRNSAAAAQTVAFSYLVGSPTVTGSLAEFQSAGTAVAALDFPSPITGGAAGALNGNLAANQVTVTSTISGLSIPNGTEVMLRWSDPDHTGADHGLSIDSFAVTPQGVTLPNLTINDVSLNEGNTGTTSFTFTVSLSAPAGPGGVTFDIGTADDSAVAPGDYATNSLTSQTIPSGSSTYSFTVNVNGDPDVETNEAFFVNVSTVTGANVTDGQGVGTVQNDDVPASADLAVTVVDSPDPVLAGNNLTYTVTVTNNGPDAASTVSLSDTLPGTLTFVSFTAPGGWSCTTPAVGAGGTVSCSIASLGVGSAVFTLVGNVPADTPAGTIFSNTATASSTTSDPSTGNESGTATTTTAVGVDLAVTVADAPDPVVAGATVTYTVTVANAGPSTAANVSLSDTLPAGTTFVSLTAPGGWSCTTPAVGATGTISCSIAALPAGSAPFTLAANVDAGVAAGTVLSNTATGITSTTDTNPGNESGTATTTVTTSADLSVTNSPSTSNAINGQPITYTITVTNAGTSNAANVTLSNPIPSGTTFTSLSSPGGWSCTTPAAGATGTVSCTLASLAPGMAVFSLTVTVDNGLPPSTIVDVATVTSTTTDPNTGNESATAMTSTPVSLQSFEVD